MKKYKLFLPTALFLALSFVSCQKEDPAETHLSTEAETAAESGYTIIKGEDTPGITVSVPAGIYTPEERPNTVILSTDTGYTIKYTTTTCTNPDVTDEIAESAVRLAYHDTGDGVTQSAIIRAALYDRGEQVGNSYTFTYISAPEGRFTTPVFSLVSDPVGLYSYETGILVAGKARDEALENGNPDGWVLSNNNANYYNTGREWEREVSIAFSETGTGGYVFSSNGGVRVNGGWTRANTQKSLKLFSRKDYTPEYGTFAIDLFPGYRDPITGRTLSFANTILLRGGSNNEGNNVIATPFQLAMCEGTDQILPAMRPVTEFINGQYKGMVFLLEDYDADFFEAHFGVPEEELAIFSGSFENYGGSMWTLDCGPESEFDLFMEVLDQLSSLNMKDEENYAYACEVLDMHNFIEYMCIEMYCGNSDWPDNNLRVFRKYTSGFSPDAAGVQDGRYRFLLKDLDLSFGSGHSVGSDPFDGALGSSNLKIREVFTNLMENEAFADQVYMYLCTLSSTVFAPERAQSVLDEFILALTPEMKYTTENLWVGGGSVARWQSYTDSLLSFAKSRVKTVRNAVEKRSAETLSTVTVQVIGAFDNMTQELGWYTVDNGHEVQYPMNTPIPYEIADNAEITAEGGEVHGSLHEGYIILTEEEAVLTISHITTEPTVESVDNPVVLNEAAYRAYDSVFIELKNRTGREVSLDGWEIGTTTMMSLDGYTIEPHGYLLISSDKDAADVPISFRMSSKYTLILKNNGETVDSLSLDTVNRTVHMGRYPNGESWITLYTTELTPGAHNVIHEPAEYLTSSLRDGLMVNGTFYPVSEMTVVDGKPGVPVTILRDYIRDFKAAYKSELAWTIKHINETIPFDEFTDFINENMRLTVRCVESVNVIILK